MHDATQAKAAYTRGWNASRTTKTFDLDAAEDRYIRQHGNAYSGDWLDGWTDAASGNPKWESFRFAPDACVDLWCRNKATTFTEAGFICNYHLDRLREERKAAAEQAEEQAEPEYFACNCNAYGWALDLDPSTTTHAMGTGPCAYND